MRKASGGGDTGRGKRGGGMIYFLAGLSASSGLAFGGLPFPGTLRMASRADLSYTAVLPAKSFGDIFAASRRFCTVFGCIPNFSAISLIVKPSIIFISENLPDFINILNIEKFTKHMLSKMPEKVKKISIWIKYILTIFIYMEINIYR